MKNKCLPTLLNSSKLSNSCKQSITGDASAATFWDSTDTIKDFISISNSLGREKSKTFHELLESQREGSVKNVTTQVDDKINGFRYTLADLIHLVLPRSRIIVILRDPVDR